MTADKVILALPIAILRQLEAAGAFAGAGLDPLMVGVFRNYPMGANAKVQLQFTDRLSNQPTHGAGESTANLHPTRATSSTGTSPAARPAPQGSWSTTPAVT